MKKLIFLDIDGVLNCEDGYINGRCGQRDKYGQLFHEESQDLINNLILETDADIVISSTWRHSGLDVMRDMWDNRGMCGNIIGITPSLFIGNNSAPRGCEINHFLDSIGLYHVNWCEDTQIKCVKNSGYDNYIIIDDDSDMLYIQRHHFIHVLPSPRNKYGFNEEYYQKALKTLSKSIIDLNY